MFLVNCVDFLELLGLWGCGESVCFGDSWKVEQVLCVKNGVEVVKYPIISQKKRFDFYAFLANCVDFLELLELWGCAKCVCFADSWKVEC